MKNSTLAMVLLFMFIVITLVIINIPQPAVALQVFFGIIDALVVVMFGMVLNDMKVKS